MEEIKNLELESIQENEEKSSFDFAVIYTIFEVELLGHPELEMVCALFDYLLGCSAHLSALCHTYLPGSSEAVDQRGAKRQKR